MEETKVKLPFLCSWSQMRGCLPVTIFGHSEENTIRMPTTYLPRGPSIDTGKTHLLAQACLMRP